MEEIKDKSHYKVCLDGLFSEKEAKKQIKYLKDVGINSHMEDMNFN